MADMLVLMCADATSSVAADEHSQGHVSDEARARALASTLPAALTRVPATSHIRLWTLGQNVAKGTVSAVVNSCASAGFKGSLKARSPEVEDSCALIKKTRSSGANCVLALAPSPFVEDMVERICGASLALSFGSLVALRLEGAAGRLLWIEAGPAVERWESLVAIERVLVTKASEVRSWLKTFFKEPDDIESVHRLRVSIRTLRSLVAFVSPWQKRSQARAIQADLRDVVRETSHLRDLDVFALRAKRTEGTSADTVEFCLEQASSERTRTLAALSGKHLRQQLERALGEVEHIAWKDSVLRRGIAAHEVRERFDALVETTSRHLAALDYADAEATHDVRKKAKRARYAAQHLSSLVGEDALGIAKEMEGRQDDLGELCDARVGIELVEDFLQRDPAEHVVWDLILLRAGMETFLYTTLREAARKG